MARNSYRSTADTILIVFFGMLALLGCICSSFAVLMTALEPGDTSYELAPFFFGLTLVGAGSVVMIAMRQRFKMGWPMLLVAVVLWSMGSAVFAFGLTATFLYDEPTEFMSNLGYSVGLCIGPGAVLALIGLFLFGYEAWRGSKREEGRADTGANSPEASASDWLRSVKADEKSKLDDGVF